MKRWWKEAFVPLFILVGLIDLGIRFFLLERESWVCNQGVFWGIELPSFWLLSLTFIFLGYIAFLFLRTKRLEERFFLFLILLGGSINMLDRLFYGCVLDYFSWPSVLGTLFPHFNLADMFLSLGLGGMVWMSLFHRERREN